MLISAMLGAKNDQAVSFDYLLNVIEMRLSILLMLFFAAGVLFSGLVFALIWIKLKWHVGRLQKQQRKAEQQKSELVSS
ncbi:lipopolysaccharide assembly protein LapA domain-containing protein [Aliiglaciecola sp. M165]|uniref:lipopolysaccharide assembly protein LapA domain-containing protein n=1 Tax=Aliiglaciecola sp. M165 TaxID=2593649 RepID=UPI00117E4A5E|nr:lipopolysaccharide assembly protein LapA domain-containing protein [Aliiglaciecola sp. M165]TRY30163.1 DUF1049 domain-containing protein [Aliiglaciecola sp. M165]